MTGSEEQEPSFNLWTQPWITLEGPRGLVRHSIRSSLLEAHEHTGVYDPSPLAVVGIHRLLVAILQDALRLEESADLEGLWDAGRLPADAIDRFGGKYGDRFDLFSFDAPFLQTSDIPREPDAQRLKSAKSVAELLPDLPTGTFVTHYRHLTEDDVVLSPGVAAAGLLTIPPFANGCGQGNMSSINGTPPVYVLPGGATLFESLAASLLSESILEDHLTTGETDLPWWRRTLPVVVNRSKKKSVTGPDRQLSEVGFLHGLTFPARRVRLYPERLDVPCTITGERAEWGVRRMAFEMGESLRDGPAPWWDPFVAFKLSGGKEKVPEPIRPSTGKAAWREFAGLLLEQRGRDSQLGRPLFLDQLSLLQLPDRPPILPFRCISLQTDQAKNLEWNEMGLAVPTDLLRDRDGAAIVRQALDLAENAADLISDQFRRAFRRNAKSKERFRRVRDMMVSDYWSALAKPFREFLLELGGQGPRAGAPSGCAGCWAETVIREAQLAFDQAAETTGYDGAALFRGEQAKGVCHGKLRKLAIKKAGGV